MCSAFEGVTATDFSPRLIDVFFLLFVSFYEYFSAKDSRWNVLLTGVASLLALYVTQQVVYSKPIDLKTFPFFFSFSFLYQ